MRKTELQRFRKLLMEEKEYDGGRAYINKVLRLSPDCRETKELEEKLNKLQNG